MEAYWDSIQPLFLAPEKGLGIGIILEKFQEV